MNTLNEDVAAMLPQVGLSGPILNKDDMITSDDYYAPDDPKDKPNYDPMKLLDEQTYKYIHDNDRVTMEKYVEESIKDKINDYKSDLKISAKVKKITTELAIMKVKLKFMNKKADPKKVIELKREIIAREQEKRKYTNPLSDEDKAEIKKLEKETTDLAQKEFDQLSDTDNDNKPDKKIIESHEDVLDCSDEIITEAVEPNSNDSNKSKISNELLAAVWTVVGGIAVTNYIAPKAAMKKYEKANNDLIPFNKLTRRVYEKLPDQMKGKNIKFFTTFANHTIEEYIYKGKTLFAVAFDRGVTKKGGEVKISFTFIDKSIEKYRDYYLCGALLKKNMTTKQLIDWSKGIIKSQNNTITEATDNKDDTNYPPELKRLDEKRGAVEDLKRKLEDANKKLEETGDRFYATKIKGLTKHIEKLNKEIQDGENQIKEIEKKNKAKKEEDEKKEKEIAESSGIEINTDVTTEAVNMDDEIKPIVAEFNDLGYKVKYASPGHVHLRKKEDKEPDGVYHGKLYTDARIMFKNKYDFPLAPKYWFFRDVDGCSYLDVTPITYNPDKGTPDEAFAKWKTDYMNTLKTFVKNLKPVNSKKKDDEVEERTVYDYLDSLYNNIITESEDTIDKKDSLKETGKKIEKSIDKMNTDKLPETLLDNAEKRMKKEANKEPGNITESSTGDFIKDHLIKDANEGSITDAQLAYYDAHKDKIIKGVATTDKQKEILNLLLSGMKEKDIATKLNVSPSRINQAKNHMKIMAVRRLRDYSKYDNK